MARVLISAVLSLLAVPATAATPPEPAAMSGRDVSHELRAFLRDGRFDAARVEAAYGSLVDELRGYRVVVVPSYLSGLLIGASRFRLADYFRSQIDALIADGIAAEVAPVDTEQTVAENGRRLAAHVAASDRPVCLVAHSKGGLDALEFLLRASAEERRKVVCWVVMQAPFGGSPVADLIAGVAWTRPFADTVLRVMGGSGRSIDDLTTAVRERYMAEHAPAIAAIVRALPVIVLATRLGEPARPSAHMRPTHRWMSELGLDNDGLVPLRSALLLPAARYVVMPGLDHTDTIAAKPVAGNPVDRVLLLKALLYLALSDRPA